MTQGKLLPASVRRVLIPIRASLTRKARFIFLRPRNMLRLASWVRKPPSTIPKTLGPIRIACILDEFSFESWKFEADFLNLPARGWREILEITPPNLLFVESAWRGKDGSWFKKVSEVSNELIELIAWARERAVPTVFWHKEVPPHMATFMTVSRMFDHVFLTDADCIPEYRRRLGHDRVHFLPFACQPKIHHPIQNEERKDAVLYAGTFYPEYKYPQRHKNFMDLFDVLSPVLPIDIFDRSAGKGHYTFPAKFHSMIRGSLPFSKVSETYRRYRYGLNMNSVKDSTTMCSRRIFELIASGTLVVGNDSLAVRNFFGDDTISSDDPTVVSKRFSEWRERPLLARAMRSRALRQALQKHTYGHRLREVLRVVGATDLSEDPRVLVLASPQNQLQATKISDNFRRQTWKNKSLLLLDSTVDLDGVERLSSASFFDRVEHHAHNFDFVAFMDANWAYGHNHLTDLILSFSFSGTEAVSRGAFHRLREGSVEYVEGPEFTLQHGADPAASVARMTRLETFARAAMSGKSLEIACVTHDGFNLCHVGNQLPSEEQIAEFSN